jgi:hypothetical protein
MTRQLQDLFDLPDDDDDNSSKKKLPEESIPESFLSDEVLDAIDKIESSLPAVKGLEASDKDMDELADLAKEAFNNLLDLGMQVDSRFSAEIFNSASSFLGHSITAKTAKVNKKLKMVQLQLQKAELDRKLAAAAAKGESATPEATPLGTGQIIDRGELIRQILEQSKNATKDK